MSTLLFDSRERIFPSDNSTYIINSGVLDYTVKVLNDYRNLNPSNEGLVYWAGTRNGDQAIVRMVVAPQASSEERRITTSHSSNANYIKTISKHGFVHIGQIHSHPGTFIDHSLGDDEWTPFKRHGLISIVVEMYGENGMSKLNTCGVHKYVCGNFERLNEQYIEERFFIDNEFDIIFKDLR